MLSGNNKPWSSQTARKEVRAARREKKVKKREAMARAAVAGSANSGNGLKTEGDSGKRKRFVDEAEWKELQDEVRLMKKIKKGLAKEEEEDGLDNDA